MINGSVVLTSALAFATALAVAFATTPIVKSFAYKIGAVDVPKDDRRMHTHPIPRVGGLAIFLGFVVSVLIFGRVDGEMKAILLGAVILVLLGIVDDVVALKPGTKFIGQILAALIPIFADIRISSLTNPFDPESSFDLGWVSIPLTVIWIVGVTNAVNFIDGLDGLSCGVSSIASLTVFTIALLVAEPYVAITMAALSGACFGFLPYNMNPAKIFMGDTGSMFLGYTLATMSITGLFKLYTMISFIVPFMILGLPLFDTGFAILRRVLKGQSPLKADRGHIHHRLVDMGFDQKQSVAILYAVSIVLGLAAVIFTTSGEMKIAIVTLAVLLCLFFAMNIKVKNKRASDAPKKEEREDEQN